MRDSGLIKLDLINFMVIEHDRVLLLKTFITSVPVVINAF